MKIGYREFMVAMEEYGVESIYDRFFGTCFEIKGTYFVHVDNDYVLLREKRVPEEIMNRAIAELGERSPEKEHFLHGEIHSVKGMMTLVSMLDENYNKRMVEKLTNKTYKELTECKALKSNVGFTFHNIYLTKMEKLYELLTEYSNIVNPFGNPKFKFKEPNQYVDVIDINLVDDPNRIRRHLASEPVDWEKEHYTYLELTNDSAILSLEKRGNSWWYKASMEIPRNKTKCYIEILHYYKDGKDNNGNKTDEVVYLYYKENSKSYRHSSKDIDLNISLKTGLTWSNDKKEEAKPVTDDQIEVMIKYLKKSIKEIKNRIVNNMIEINTLY